MESARAASGPLVACHHHDSGQERSDGAIPRRIRRARFACRDTPDLQGSRVRVRRSGARGTGGGGVVEARSEGQEPEGGFLFLTEGKVSPFSLTRAGLQRKQRLIKRLQSRSFPGMNNLSHNSS